MVTTNLMCSALATRTSLWSCMFRKATLIVGLMQMVICVLQLSEWVCALHSLLSFDFQVSRCPLSFSPVYYCMTFSGLVFYFKCGMLTFPQYDKSTLCHCRFWKPSFPNVAPCRPPLLRCFRQPFAGPLGIDRRLPDPFAPNPTIAKSNS